MNWYKFSKKILSQVLTINNLGEDIFNLIRAEAIGEWSLVNHRTNTRTYKYQIWESLRLECNIMNKKYHAIIHCRVKRVYDSSYNGPNWSENLPKPLEPSKITNYNPVSGHHLLDFILTINSEDAQLISTKEETPMQVVEKINSTINRDMFGNDNDDKPPIDSPIPSSEQSLLTAQNNSIGIRLWLDDERNPKDPFIQKNFGSNGDEIWVKTIHEAKSHLSQNKVSSISLDHDLGKNTPNGYQLAKYIEEQAFHGKINPISWRVHSQNPAGANNIRRALQNAEKFWQSGGLKKEAELSVQTLSANSYGDLSILINGKQYDYILPYSATEVEQQLSIYKGKALAKLVKWLDQFLIKNKIENKKIKPQQMVLPFPR